ncbi:MAG: sulfate ABC transporter substrate-binding protein [Wenzhouxiangella sp.]|nr:MAG: sulfate ABC transporter substrate-binding protein [Wenzhouxiangella sp.]
MSMMTTNLSKRPLAAFLGAVCLMLVGCGSGTDADVTLLNVSYDPTREFYLDINPRFAEHWQQQHGQRILVRQSHGGSGSQARAVIDGLEADVVTLALGFDIDAIHQRSGLVRADWNEQLPDNSAPYTSTIVFLVRKGNPLNIQDWDDLIRPGVQVITPNPKTSGGARWNYLAAWGYALLNAPDDLDDEGREAYAREFTRQVYANVPILDRAARAATNTFVQRRLGDVFLSWENEALLAIRELGPDEVEVVMPSVSVLAEPSVAVVDGIVDRRGTRDVAEAYLRFLYTDEAQQLAARHYFRPRNQVVLDAFSEQFPPIDLFSVEELLGSWAEIQRIHFDDGGVFDSFYRDRR